MQERGTKAAARALKSWRGGKKSGIGKSKQRNRGQEWTEVKKGGREIGTTGLHDEKGKKQGNANQGGKGGVVKY